MAATGLIKIRWINLPKFVMKMTGNPHIALEVGRFAPSSKAAGSMTNFLTGFITPSAAYTFMGKMYSPGQPVLSSRNEIIEEQPSGNYGQAKTWSGREILPVCKPEG